MLYIPLQTSYRKLILLDVFQGHKNKYLCRGCDPLASAAGHAPLQTVSSSSSLSGAEEIISYSFIVSLAVK